MAKKKPNRSGLTAAEVRAFKTLLLAKRNEIVSNVICMEDETLRRSRTELSNMPLHMADMGTDTYEMEHTLGLMDSERKLLVEVEDALGRIEDGTYGICEGNHEPIPRERLNAIPWARYCVGCANSLEKGLSVEEEVHGQPNNYDETDDEQDEESEKAGGEEDNYE